VKPYLLSLGAGLLVGIVYSLISVRSPAPPTPRDKVLLGILIGEQVVPIAKRLFSGQAVSSAWLKSDCGPHVLGELPGRSAAAPPTEAPTPRDKV